MLPFSAEQAKSSPYKPSTLFPRSVSTSRRGSSTAEKHSDTSRSTSPLTAAARQDAEEQAYLARRDTKERPPAHMVERERKNIDWKGLRHKGSAPEVVQELLKMTTKNLKNPTDAPKRPMNGESSLLSLYRTSLNVCVSISLLPSPCIRPTYSTHFLPLRYFPTLLATQRS